MLGIMIWYESGEVMNFEVSYNNLDGPNWVVGKERSSFII